VKSKSRFRDNEVSEVNSKSKGNISSEAMGDNFAAPKEIDLNKIVKSLINENKFYTFLKIVVIFFISFLILYGFLYNRNESVTIEKSDCDADGATIISRADSYSDWKISTDLIIVGTGLDPIIIDNFTVEGKTCIQNSKDSIIKIIDTNLDELVVEELNSDLELNFEGQSNVDDLLVKNGGLFLNIDKKSQSSISDLNIDIIDGEYILLDGRFQNVNVFSGAKISLSGNETSVQTLWVNDSKPIEIEFNANLSCDSRIENAYFDSSGSLSGCGHVDLLVVNSKDIKIDTFVNVIITKGEPYKLMSKERTTFYVDSYTNFTEYTGKYTENKRLVNYFDNNQDELYSFINEMIESFRNE